MITIYKRKSGGVVLGEFNSIEEFITAEHRARARAKEHIRKQLYDHQYGLTKSMKSDLYQTEIVIKKTKNETDN